MALTLATEQGFAFWLARGTFLQGWALTTQGDARRALPRCARALRPHAPSGQK